MRNDAVAMIVTHNRLIDLGLVAGKVVQGEDGTFLLQMRGDLLRDFTLVEDVSTASGNKPECVRQLRLPDHVRCGLILRERYITV